MIRFKVSKGTDCELVEHHHVDGCDIYHCSQWIVRQDLFFEKCVIDPVRYYDAKDKKFNIPDVFVEFAQQGYAVFGGKCGDDHTAPFTIAVPYSEVAIQ